MRPTPDTSPDFRLSLTGSYELVSTVPGLDKAFVGTITFGTKKVRLDGDATYYGQKLSLSGQIQTSSGTLGPSAGSGDYLLCTPDKTVLTLSAASGLPAGRGRVCLGAAAVTVEMDSSAESAWTKRDNVSGVFYPWELDQGTFEGLAKCPGSNLITIYPAGGAVEFCAGSAPQNKLSVTTSIFVQLVVNLHISQTRPYGGPETPVTVTSDGYMRWRENTWSLYAQSGVDALTVEPLAAASAPLQPESSA